MNSCRSDLTLTEALSDPIIGAVMDADQVDRNELQQSLVSLAQQLGLKRKAARAHLCCE
jgi:hypothetical protein